MVTDSDNESYGMPPSGSTPKPSDSGTKATYKPVIIVFLFYLFGLQLSSFLSRSLAKIRGAGERLEKVDRGFKRVQRGLCDAEDSGFL